jgi:hypothetical protein
MRAFLKFNSNPNGACEDGFSYGEVEDYTVIVAGELTEGKIQGFVRDAETNLAIDDAIITAIDANGQVSTNETPFGSHYMMILPEGMHTFTCEATGYETAIADVMIMGDENVHHTFYLEPERMITGLDEAEISQVRISPNPSSDGVKIQSMAEISQLNVFNQAGQLVYEINSNSTVVDVDVSEFDSGIYFVRIFTNNDVVIRKLVVE